MIKNFWIKFTEHSVLYIVVMIQFIFVLALSVKACVTPRQVVSLVASAMFKSDGRVANVEGDILKFISNDYVNEEDDWSIFSEHIRLQSGAYRVYVSYDSMVSEGKITESNANVQIFSRCNITFDSLILNDQNNVAVGRLWIPALSNCNDLRVKISYDGSGTLSVSNITFEEARQYRLTRILGFIMLFAVTDTLILILFSEIKLKIKWSYGVLLLIVFISSIPFLRQALFYGHDLWVHILRIVSVARELRNGQFPIRMATELNNGYGYPFSIYYCDIFLYPSAVLYLMYVPLRTCYQIYVIGINAATTIFTYISLEKFTKKEHLRLIGTGLYVLCVYRLVNLNVRAATGEYTAMTFLPLIIAGMYLIYTTEKPTYKEWSYLALGMSGIIMSHVLTCVMVVINLALLCVMLIKKTFKKEIFFSIVKAALLCTGITAWFIIPFGDFMINQDTVVQNAYYPLQVYARQLIYIFQMFAPGEAGGYYTTLGMPLIAGLGMILWYLVKYKEFRKSQAEYTLRLMCILTIINIFLVSEYFPWAKIQSLNDKVGTLQFPWRFLGMASVILSFAVVLTFELLESKKCCYIRVTEFGILACIVLSVGFFYYEFGTEVGASSYNTVQSYENADSLYLLYGTDVDQDKSKVQTISGDVMVSAGSKNKGIYSVQVDNSDTEAVIAVPIYGYQYYKAYDEAGGQLKTDVAESKCLAVWIPENYSGNIIVKFVPPIFWRISEIVSIVCVVLAFLQFVRIKHKENIKLNGENSRIKKTGRNIEQSGQAELC